MRQHRWLVPSPPCSSGFPPLDCHTTLASLLASCSTLEQAISCRRHTATGVPLSPSPSPCWVSFSPLSSRASSDQRGGRSDIFTTPVFYAPANASLYASHVRYA